MKADYGELNVSRIVEIGKPLTGLHPDATAFAVSVKVECGPNMGSRSHRRSALRTTRRRRRRCRGSFSKRSSAKTPLPPAGTGRRSWYRRVRSKRGQGAGSFPALQGSPRGCGGQSGTVSQTNRLEVPVKVELEMKNHKSRNSRHISGRSITRPDRWGDLRRDLAPLPELAVEYVEAASCRLRNAAGGRSYDFQGQVLSGIGFGRSSGGPLRGSARLSLPSFSQRPFRAGQPAPCPCHFLGAQKPLVGR